MEFINEFACAVTNDWNLIINENNKITESVKKEAMVLIVHIANLDPEIKKTHDINHNCINLLNEKCAKRATGELINFPRFNTLNPNIKISLVTKCKMLIDSGLIQLHPGEMKNGIITYKNSLVAGSYQFEVTTDTKKAKVRGSSSQQRRF